jgi:predicted outer membrane repeat protein
VTRGGGIYIEGGGEVTLQGGVIGNPEFTLEGKSANESDLTDLAYGNKADDGGGVYVANNAIFNMNGGSINGNIAKKRSGITYGGGAIQSYGTVNISGGTLSNNAGCVGGALEVSSGTFDISGGTFSNNRAFTDDQNTGSTGNGGAVYIKSVTGKTVKIENAVFEDNIALRFGGAMEFFCDLSVTFDNVTVKNNSATLDGGGIVVDRSGTLTISSGTTFSGNKSRYGGGICMYSADSKLIVNGGIFTGNSAESGGGIYTRAKYVTIESGSITNNTASGNGGGLYVTTNVTESSTADITASVKINGGSITGNTATGSGGGVYVTGNRATNKTTNVVYIGMVNVTITGGSVTNNTATVDGGGVYVTSSGTVAVTVEGGSITGNYAVNGGGIAVVPQDNAEAAVVIGTYGCTEESGHTHPDISKNTASGDGGGVYISSGSATMYCGTISSNKLADGTSSDVSQTGGAFETAGGTIETDPIVTGGEYKDTSESGGNVGDEAYYKVSYYSNYTGSNESNTVTVNTVTVIGNKTSVSVTLPDSKKFTSDGYYIIGWSTTTDSESTSSKYDTGETVVLWSLLNIADDSAESTENTTVEGNGTEADPYIISFYAVWAEEAVEVGSAASYVVTIPAAMSIGTNGSSKQGTVRAVLENFRYNNRLNVTVSSRNTYELVNSAPAGSKQKVFYNLYLDGGSVTVIQSSDDENSSSGENSSDKISGDSASVDEETVTVTGNRRTKLTNSNDSNSVLAFSKQSVSNATITQNIIAELDESSTPVTVAGTYTDILTFTVNFG